MNTQFSQQSAAQYFHRLATLDDLPAIVAIYNSTIPSRQVTADIEPVTVASRLNWFNEHSAGKRPIWVVEDHGQMLGWLSYSNFHARAAYVHTAEISIYLAQDARGKGLGAYFLTEAIAFASALDIHTLVGLIFAHNEPSLKLFERFGFERWADMPRVATLDGVERDLIIVGKRIA
ncbi:GNAT family N-acetyltransferase [Herminiimonas fonticola]|uniref:Phosphinothricin acetyltransferase n=1 Tax=Herminiimonas fonticola TaxID=303380 RepID=A0A4R6G8U6_9BURK|nr:GNAT family N-acetyltransferase [Herminiimonas fonticola]RBA24244.1 Sortase and related acyltransferase [Herminiimonas fonticola]TDN90245.1 phosphinothricin acetyltransferase [Herminiimonas fonticola]